jgi:hypothetical protein
MSTKLNENTELQIPLKNLIGMVAGAATATWLYFGVLERLNSIDHTLEMMKQEQKLNSEFRIKWPRGELGALPADSRQDIMIEFIQDRIKELDEKVK